MLTNRYPRAARACLTLCALLWTGCAASVCPQPPLLQCPPAPPEPREVTPDGIAVYLVDVWEAGQRCREAVDGYQAWAEGVR